MTKRTRALTVSLLPLLEQCPGPSGWPEARFSFRRVLTRFQPHSVVLPCEFGGSI
jgi:hypothetical protein